MSDNQHCKLTLCILMFFSLGHIETSSWYYCRKLYSTSTTACMYSM